MNYSHWGFKKRGDWSCLSTGGLRLVTEQDRKAGRRGAGCFTDSLSYAFLFWLNAPLPLGPHPKLRASSKRTPPPIQYLSGWQQDAQLDPRHILWLNPLYLPSLPLRPP